MSVADRHRFYPFHSFSLGQDPEPHMKVAIGAPVSVYVPNWRMWHKGVVTQIDHNQVQVTCHHPASGYMTQTWVALDTDEIFVHALQPGLMRRCPCLARWNATP